MARDPLVPTHSLYFSTEGSSVVQLKVSVVPLSVVPGVGLVISGQMTVTIWVAVPVSPATSVALQMTVVVPAGNGPVSSGVGVSEPSTRSAAVAAPGARRL